MPTQGFRAIRKAWPAQSACRFHCSAMTGSSRHSTCHVARIFTEDSQQVPVVGASVVSDESPFRGHTHPAAELAGRCALLRGRTGAFYRGPIAKRIGLSEAGSDSQRTTRILSRESDRAPLKYRGYECMKAPMVFDQWTGTPKIFSRAMTSSTGYLSADYIHHAPSDEACVSDRDASVGEPRFLS